MKYHRTLLCSLALKVLVFMIPSITHSQSVEDIRHLCGNLTSANRALVEGAGYDVATICADPQVTNSKKKASPSLQIVTRPTVSDKGGLNRDGIASVVAPVNVSGVRQAVAASNLKPFGYNLFANAPSTFAPSSSIPVPANYILGPGDTLEIMFYGKLNSEISLEVNREGYVDFPELGPVGLAGMTFDEAKEMLQSRIAAQIVGTKVSISMGTLRTMQIFVLGEAHKPGAYTVSSLATITHALVSSGGISDIGSLRKIQLKRSGVLVATLDLYDFLLNGDTSGDLHVQAGDVIYIPTVGEVVSIEGQVLRPAIYEMKGGESISDLILLAGGTGPKASSPNATLRRVDQSGFMRILDLDLRDSDQRALMLKSGDHLKIESIIDENRKTVSISGHLYYPKNIEYTKGMRISDLLQSISAIRPGLDLNYSVIRRVDPLTGHFSAIQVNIGQIIENPASIENIRLEDKDQLRLFSIDGDRSNALADLIDALFRQTRANEMPNIITVDGARLPGTYPLTKRMRISDLVAAAGGLTPNYADLDYSLLVREESYPISEIKILPVDLRAALNSSGGVSDLLLQPKDRLIIFSVNEDRADTLQGTISRLKYQQKIDFSAKIVEVAGTVRFPGVYPLTEDMTLKDLLTAAGGLTESAYKQSAEIARIDLSNPESASFNVLASNLNKTSKHYLKPGDVVRFRTIPNYSDSKKIRLSGEVVFPGEYAIEKGETLSSVVNRAGGFTNEAFIDGGRFTRESVRSREQQELERLIESLNAELSSERLRDVNSAVTVDQSQLLVQRQAISALSSMEVSGRVVIPIADIMNGKSEDVILKDGDALFIPKFSQEVTVIGEVQRPTSYLFDRNFSRTDYINQAGGITQNGDRKGIYVVKASGEIIKGKRGLLSMNFTREKIGPGDTIVVPLDADRTRIRGMSAIAQVSTIIYQLALGAAAFNNINNN